MNWAERLLRSVAAPLVPAFWIRRITRDFGQSAGEELGLGCRPSPPCRYCWRPGRRARRRERGWDPPRESGRSHNERLRASTQRRRGMEANGLGADSWWWEQGSSELQLRPRSWRRAAAGSSRYMTPTPEVAKAVGRQHGVRVVADYASALSWDEIDAVVIATPTRRPLCPGESRPGGGQVGPLREAAHRAAGTRPATGSAR